ncbi:MAG: hemolysin III family protein [Polyangiales bacterium]
MTELAVRRFGKDPVSGYSHLAGLGVAVVGACWLLSRRSTDFGTSLTRIIYVLGLVTLYASSSAYHLFHASERATKRLRQLDHVAIFLMVAGTSTPLFYYALTGTPRVAMLTCIWLVAVLGIVFRIVWLSAPRALYTTLYVALGWAVVFQWNAVMAGLPQPALVLLIAGGIAYTVGAGVYASKRPDPFPKVFGSRSAGPRGRHRGSARASSSRWLPPTHPVAPFPLATLREIRQPPTRSRAST